MECMEARALKSSFTSKIGVNASIIPQIVMDDYYWYLNNNNNNGLLQNDEFSIDQFFDLPNEDDNSDNSNGDGSGFVVKDDDEEEEEEDVSLCSQEFFEESHSSLTHFETELAIPVDDVQELELWSHLMDDSIPEPTLACPNPLLDAYKSKTGFNFMNRVEPVYKPAFYRVPVIPSAVPVKPRTKRSRTTGLSRSWVFGSSPKTESSSSSSSSSSPVSTLFFPPPVHETGLWFNYGKPPTKKPKKKPTVSSLVGENPPVQRRCSHCQVTKTPQWRAGPNGPKTLCNACGVRFKSGRLFPEYRPACSPTFSSEVHSNSHRKVLEMRKKKEGNEPISGSPLTVLSS